MLLPASLRETLSNAFEEFRIEPANLIIIVSNANSQFYMGQDLSFVEKYTLEIAISNFSGNPLMVKFAILKWLVNNRPELLSAGEMENGILPMRVDWVDKDTANLDLKIELFENFIATPIGNNNFEIEALQNSIDPLLLEELQSNPILRHLYINDDATPILNYEQ